MKKIFLITLLVSLVLGAFLPAKSQVRGKRETPRIEKPRIASSMDDSPVLKGNYMAGGSVANLDYNFETRGFGLNLNPKAGYFVADLLAAGATFDLNIKSVSDKTSAAFSIGPFVRYYFRDIGDAGKLYGELNAGFSAAKGADVGLGLEAGYSHWINRSVAIEAGPYYKHVGNSNSIGAKVGFQIFLAGRR